MFGESIAGRVVQSSRGVSDSIHRHEVLKLLTGERRAIVRDNLSRQSMSSENAAELFDSFCCVYG